MPSPSLIPKWLGWSAAILVALFWTLLVPVPLIAVLSSAASFDLLFDPVILRTLRITVGQALLSSAISASIGLPLGLWLGSRGGRSARWAESILAIPFGVPSIVAAFCWVSLLGRNGPLGALDWSYSLSAVVLAHVFFNIPWVALLVAQARRAIDRSWLEAADTLGAKAWERFSAVLWPAVRWSFASAVAQTFAFCSMSFALVWILGGGPPVQTLETALFARVRYGTLDLSAAAALAAWELLITVLPWSVVAWLEARSSVRTISQRRDARSGSAFGPLAMAVLLVLPYFAAFRNRAPGDLSVEFWQAVKEPLWISIRLAAAAGFAALIAASSSVIAVATLPSRLRAVAQAALAMPSGISALVLGLGIWLAFSRWIDPFEGSFFAICAIQTVLFFPVAFRVLWPLLQSFPKNQIESALSLGASPIRAFLEVEWPRWRRPMAAAFALVAAASLGEVGAVSLFYSENLIPLPLLVSRWMGQYRFEEAQVVSALLLTLSAVTVLFVFWTATERKSFDGQSIHKRPI